MSKWNRPGRSSRRWALAVIERDGMECCWCSETMWRSKRPKGSPKSLRFTLDHVVPRNGSSGLNTVDNLLGSCYECNHTRGNMTMEEYFPLSKYPRLDVIEDAIRRMDA